MKTLCTMQTISRNVRRLVFYGMIEYLQNYSLFRTETTNASILRFYLVVNPYEDYSFYSLMTLRKVLQVFRVSRRL